MWVADVWVADVWAVGSVDDGFRGVLKGDLKGWESLEEAALRRRRLDAGDEDMSVNVSLSIRIVKNGELMLLVESL